MKTIQEVIDREFFIDILVTPKELDNVFHGDMLSTELRIGREIVHIGIRKPIKGEDDAISQR